MNNEIGITARVGVSGLIEYRDKDGNIIKTVPFNGSVNANQEEDDGNGSE